MPIFAWSLFAASTALSLFLWRRLRQAQRTLDLNETPLPQDWLEAIEANVGLYHRLPSPLKAQLLGRTLEFLNRKTFEGHGLEVTPAMRVTVAAQACFLWLNRQGEPFPHLHVVRLFPSNFKGHDNPIERGSEETGLDEALVGEASSDGVIALAWDNARKTASDLRDGQNLVLHEFAHNLDHEDGNEIDGTPTLPTRGHLTAWGRAHAESTRMLKTRIERGFPALLDRYATTDAGEFFAVSTEVFFESPRKMKDLYPDYYKVLTDYYRVDPLDWNKAAKTA